jgi:uncharacterized alpha-E superfamily protein
MLSRTADHVYWLGRFAERAEGLARTLDVQYRLSLLPQDRNDGGKGWLCLLRALGAEQAYLARHPEPEAQRVVDFLAYDKSNPGSILSCLRAARDNARAVRGSISSEMWETFNATWLEARALEPGRFSADNVAEFVDWVKARAHLARGVVLASMLRDEAYHFMQIGTFLERVDSVARMLLIRLTCEPAADEGEGEGAAIDYYSWSVLLRGLSAFESFRRVSRDSVRPRHVLEFVILNPYVPRSLYRSSHLIHENLQSVANARSGETERRAGLLHAELRYGSLDTLAPHGSAAFLGSVLARVDDLSERIRRDFLGHTA